jgi:hypothetical protein
LFKHNDFTDDSDDYQPAHNLCSTHKWSTYYCTHDDIALHISPNDCGSNDCGSNDCGTDNGGADDYGTDHGYTNDSGSYDATSDIVAS